MQLPPFLDLVGEALVFNQENKELLAYIPELFFNEKSKRSIAEIIGQRISTIGLFEYCIIDANGKKTELKPFRFPTMILMKPYKIEKAKGLVLDNEVEETNDNDDEENEISVSDINRLAKDYRILHFKKGDEVICHTRVPQLIDNVEMFYKLAIITAKLPTSIPYDEIWKLFLESMELNGNDYGLNAQLFGIVSASLCRDPNDISKPFRYTTMKNLNGYKPISVKLIPNYISPYTSIISEDFQESLTSAILMKDMPEDQIPYSPLEKIIMQ